QRKKSFDEATMLPFADDPEAKKHVEQASRSNKE
ncbi:CcoQ/FixQ family Cbb3-type cytochrome c oxidase assembly chaperone, partial [Pseudomonas aeruginosa]|nr:CcoQ/FixQ family Cbb3-type cytochrome c oxidase assembly chaperone [Pseudomonas aeruginosa]